MLNQGEEDDAYKVQFIWEYEEEIDEEKLKEGWKYAQERYGSLRMRFGWEEELIQVIDKEGELDWRYIDISSKKNQEKELEKIQREDRKEGYKLEEGSLFRVYLIKRKKDLYTCLFSNHHIILDGWSNPILF